MVTNTTNDSLNQSNGLPSKESTNKTINNEDLQNVVGFFGILLEIDQRVNPEYYQTNTVNKTNTVPTHM